MYDFKYAINKNDTLHTIFLLLLTTSLEAFELAMKDTH